MLLIFFNFLRQYWLGIAGGVLLAGMYVEHIEITHLHGEVTAYQSENAALKSANQQLAAAVKTQDEAVALLQAESQAKSQAAAKALAAAQKDAKKYARDAERIHLRKATGNACKDMIRLLNAYVKQGG